MAAPGRGSRRSEAVAARRGAARTGQPGARGTASPVPAGAARTAAGATRRPRRRGRNRGHRGGGARAREARRGGADAGALGRPQPCRGGDRRRMLAGRDAIAAAQGASPPHGGALRARNRRYRGGDPMRESRLIDRLEAADPAASLEGYSEGEIQARLLALRSADPSGPHRRRRLAATALAGAALIAIALALLPADRGHRLPGPVEALAAKLAKPGGILHTISDSGML